MSIPQTTYRQHSEVFLIHLLLAVVIGYSVPSLSLAGGDSLEIEATRALKKSIDFYSIQARHGGYVYHVDLDANLRWGEGKASDTQIWVQPPATPTVGMAYLKAYRATGEPSYLRHATAAGRALAYGQLKSGGWTNSIDFDPKSERTALYRNGKGRGRNYSSLDDGQTQSAIRLLVALDHALKFQDPQIHESATVALNTLLAAQFPNGGFPQVWSGPSKSQGDSLLSKTASYPDYDWRTQGRIKEYWNMYTINDNVTGDVAETLRDAHRVYADKKYLQSLSRLGDFLLKAQMPSPQPGWAQQYNYQMQPIWARAFEPPAIASDESQEVVGTLLLVYDVTGDEKYLAPILPALAYLRKSRLSDGSLARYYELKSNKPLYMKRSGKVYGLTYDDSKLPSHYGWKIESRVDKLQKAHDDRRSGRKRDIALDYLDLRVDVTRIVKQLDAEGRWVSVYDGAPLVGQPKMAKGTRYLSSEVFSRNVETLSKFVGR